MVALTKNDISVTVRDRAKRTQIKDHKGYKGPITNIFKNSKLYKKNQNCRLDQKSISVTVRDTAKGTKIWDHKGFLECNNKYFQKFKFVFK